MTEMRIPGLRVVDGGTLAPELRAVLRPGELVTDPRGELRRLPRYFFEIDAYKTARSVELAPGFGLYEFVATDLHEADVLRGFPRYVPCAVAVVAAHLALLRREVDTYVHIAANGAYRSPAHARSHPGSTHAWGTAVNIYRIGDDYLEDAETIGRYAEIVRRVLPGMAVRPFGHSTGFADDHLHLDLGYTTVVPPGMPGENAEAAPAPEATAQAGEAAAEVAP